MKCIICNSRKAKRHCPAKRTEICAVCCGEKRGIEISCPEDCRYLVEGHGYQQKKLTHQRIKKDGAGAYVRRAELYKRNPQLFACIEYALVDAYMNNNSINDRDVRSALELILKTLQSESKGLIFKHRADDVMVNELADVVEQEINKLKNDPHNNVTVNFCYDVVQDFLNEVKFYIEMNPEQKSYLLHLAKFHRDRIKPEQKHGGIII